MEKERVGHCYARLDVEMWKSARRSFNLECLCYFSCRVMSKASKRKLNKTKQNKTERKSEEEKRQRRPNWSESITFYYICNNGVKICNDMKNSQRNDAMICVGNVAVQLPALTAECAVKIKRSVIARTATMNSYHSNHSKSSHNSNKCAVWLHFNHLYFAAHIICNDHRLPKYGFNMASEVVQYLNKYSLEHTSETSRGPRILGEK